VDIQVLDRNDSPPKFREPKKQITISESSPMDYEIVTLVATDEDTLGNVSYSIVSGDDGSKFRIGTETGVLRLSDPLDREERDEFLLIIRATDGIQHSDMKLRILIKGETTYQLVAFSLLLQPIHHFLFLSHFSFVMAQLTVTSCLSCIPMTKKRSK